ncbi:hypothetical protein EON65_51245 [archaeon]|nr:MAG: hypothetical protein EON65_51245 [archaeon]
MFVKVFILLLLFAAISSCSAFLKLQRSALKTRATARTPLQKHPSATLFEAAPKAVKRYSQNLAFGDAKVLHCMPQQVIVAAINGPLVTNILVNSVVWGVRAMFYYVVLGPSFDLFRDKVMYSGSFDEMYARVFSLAALVNVASFVAAHALDYFNFSVKAIQRAMILTNLAAKGVKTLGTFFAAGMVLFSLYAVMTGEKDFQDAFPVIFAMPLGCALLYVPGLLLGFP